MSGAGSLVKILRNYDWYLCSFKSKTAVVISTACHLTLCHFSVLALLDEGDVKHEEKRKGELVDF